MPDKYKYTATELFKLRMQFKAEFNDLRKTYNEIVLEKPLPQRKHYNYAIPQTAIVPEQQRSVKKVNHQKRHYSPILYTRGAQKSSTRCKKQFEQRSVDNLAKVLTQKWQSKQKSLSQVMTSTGNRSMIQLQAKDNLSDGLKVGVNDKSLKTLERTCIKIIPKYHQYDKKFFG